MNMSSAKRSWSIDFHANNCQEYSSVALTLPSGGAGGNGLEEVECRAQIGVKQRVH